MCAASHPAVSRMLITSRTLTPSSTFIYPLNFMKILTPHHQALLLYFAQIKLLRIAVEEDLKERDEARQNQRQMQFEADKQALAEVLAEEDSSPNVIEAEDKDITDSANQENISLAAVLGEDYSDSSDQEEEVSKSANENQIATLQEKLSRLEEQSASDERLGQALIVKMSKLEPATKDKGFGLSTITTNQMPIFSKKGSAETPGKPNQNIPSHDVLDLLNASCTPSSFSSPSQPPSRSAPLESEQLTNTANVPFSHLLPPTLPVPQNFLYTFLHNVFHKRLKNFDPPLYSHFVSEVRLTLCHRIPFTSIAPPFFLWHV